MRPQPRVWQEQTHERSHHGHTGNHPAFPAQWFYGVLRALPGDEFVLPPSLPDWRLVEPGWARFASDSLAPATGARTTTTWPYAKSADHPARRTSLTRFISPCD